MYKDTSSTTIFNVYQSMASTQRLFHFYDIWAKIFKNGPSKICGRQPSKILKWYGLLRHTISLQIFKSCLPQILLGPFFNTSPHFILVCFFYLCTALYNFHMTGGILRYRIFHSVDYTLQYINKFLLNIKMSVVK